MPRGVLGSADRACATRGQRPSPFPTFRAPGEDQTRAASSPGTHAEHPALPGTRKAVRRFIGVTRRAARKRADPAWPSVRRARRDARHSGPPRPRNGNPHAVPPLPAPRPDGPHDASRPGPPAPANSRKSIRPPRRHLRQQIGTQVPVALLAHQAAAALASRRERPAQRCTRSRNGHSATLSVAVRGKPTVRTDRPHGPDAVRHTSVDTATHRLTVTQRDTRYDKKKTARGPRFRSQGAVFAGSGRCWVRTNVG